MCIIYYHVYERKNINYFFFEKYKKRAKRKEMWKGWLASSFECILQWKKNEKRKWDEKHRKANVILRRAFRFSLTSVAYSFGILERFHFTHVRTHWKKIILFSFTKISEWTKIFHLHGNHCKVEVVVDVIGFQDIRSFQVHINWKLNYK